jgi:uncharacterized protein YbaP (TraB family)
MPGLARTSPKSRPASTAAALAALAAALLMTLFAGRASADQALFWRAVSPAGQELYMLGSLHMARTSFYPLKDILYEAFDRSGTLVLELDPDSTELGATLNIISEKGFYAQPDTLFAHLDPDSLEMLSPYAERLPGGDETSMKPWLAAVTVSVSILEELGYLVKEGVDRHFLAKARERDMTFVELETPAEQLNVFADMSETESLMFLRATLLELKDIEGFMDEMVGAWTDGDAARFEEAFFSTYKAWPELSPLLDKVIFDRNQTMFERLEPVLDNPGKPVFAVLGSGHLVGPRGIPALFAAAGWQVEKF